jgi:uncharacterized membrane protein
MKKYLKRGIAVVVPVLLVIQVFVWVGGFSKNIFEQVTGLSIEWWGVVLGILIALTAILIIGVTFTHIKFLKRWKDRIENRIVNRIPVVGSIYKFGSDVVETFASDIKDDDFTVIEVNFAGFKMLGILTDKENSLGFLISAPSPLTGIVMKLPNYKVIDMSFSDAIKINTSLGRINGQVWKNKEE